jgi:hypothetical protein
MAALIMTGCQQVDAPSDRPQSQDLPAPGYQAEVMRLKQSGTTIGFEEALIALQRKYNLLPEQPPAGSGNAPSALNAAAKTAADKILYTQTIALKGTYHKIIRSQGVNGTISVQATATGSGDPMIALVRFLDDPVYHFPTTGMVNPQAQDSFQIAYFDDDNGGLSASIHYPKPANDLNHYYMLVVMPYSNQTTGTTTISYYQSGCADKPNSVCESSTETVPLVGNIYRTSSNPQTWTASSVNGSDPVLMGFDMYDIVGPGFNNTTAGCNCFNGDIGGMYEDDDPAGGRGSRMPSFWVPNGLVSEGHYRFMLTMKYKTESADPAAATSVFTAANPYKVP